MALNPSTKWPSQTLPPDADYPHGRARNVAVSGDGTGTPFTADLINDIWGFLQAILAGGDVSPSGSPDTALASDYLDALRAQLPSRDPDPGAENGRLLYFDRAPHPLRKNTLFESPLAIGATTRDIVADGDIEAEGLYADRLLWRTPQSRTILIPAADISPCNADEVVEFAAPGLSYARVGLARYVPSHATITSIKARVKPGAARTGTNRMMLTVRRITGDEQWLTVGNQTYDDGTDAYQDIGITSFPLLDSVDNATKRMHAIVQSGNVASGQVDKLAYIEVQYTTQNPGTY